MSQKMRIYSFRKMIPVLIMQVLGMICLWIMLATPISHLLNGPTNLYEIDSNELYGQYIEAESFYLFEYFAERVEASSESAIDQGYGEVTERYYVIPINETDCIALLLTPDQFGDASRLIRDVSRMMYTGSEVNSFFPIEGTITTMDGEIEEYYYEWFEESNYYATSERTIIRQYAFPYVIEVGSIGLYTFTEILIFTGIFLVIAGLFFYKLLRLAVGGYAVRVPRYVTKQTSYPISTIDHDLVSAKKIGESNIWIGEKGIYFLERYSLTMLAFEDLVWAFQRTRRYKYATVYYLVLASRNKRKYQARARELDIVNTLNALKQLKLPMVIGYNDTLSELFKDDFDLFLQRADKVISPEQQNEQQ